MCGFNDDEDEKFSTSMSEEQVEALRKQIYEDGIVEKEEVLDLWDKKDTQSITSTDFDDLFVNAVMDWLTEDGEIDDEEAKFLIEKINEDDDVDDAEESLLNAINEFKEGGGKVSQLLVEAFPDFIED